MVPSNADINKDINLFYSYVNTFLYRDELRSLLSSLTDAAERKTINDAVEIAYKRLLDAKERSNKFKLSKSSHIGHHDRSKIAGSDT